MSFTMDSGIELMSENSTMDGSFLTDTWEYMKIKDKGQKMDWNFWMKRKGVERSPKERDLAPKQSHGRSIEDLTAVEQTPESKLSDALPDGFNDTPKSVGHLNVPESSTPKASPASSGGAHDRQRKAARDRTNVEDWKIRRKRDTRTNENAEKKKAERLSVEVEMHNLQLQGQNTAPKNEECEETALTAGKILVVKKQHLKAFSGASIETATHSAMKKVENPSLME